MSFAGADFRVNSGKSFSRAKLVTKLNLLKVCDYTFGTISPFVVSLFVIIYKMSVSMFQLFAMTILV